MNADDDTFPWDRAEPYVPALSASLMVVEGTRLETFDFASEGVADRVVGLTIGDLTLHLGLEGDAERITVIDRLTDALRELRDAATSRSGSAPRPPVTPTGVPA